MKKHLIFLIVLGFTGLILAGCGGVTKTTLRTSPTPNVKYIPVENTVYLTGIRKVAVFPLADYSHQQDTMDISEWGGNLKIQEEITDHLVSHGLTVAIQEDVNTLLMDQNIIRPVDRDNYLIYGTFEEEDDAIKRIGSPEHEIANYEHSPDMTREIMQVIKRENRKKKQNLTKSPILQGATVGLSREKVVELGQILDVDMIIRGRIIDYGYRDIGTLNPLYRGFVPVAIDSVKDLLFGATSSYGYEDDLEDIESIMMGTAMGAVIGNNIVSSSTSHSSSLVNGVVTRRRSSSRRSHDDHLGEGAAIGAGAGWLAAQHPKKAKRSAVVQVRIYAQDAETGNVLWSNRVEMEYTPKSNFAYEETHPKTMFDKAVREGVKALMDSFFTEAENVLLDSGEVTPIQKEGA